MVPGVFMIKNDVLTNIEEYIDVSYLEQLEQKYNLIIEGNSLFKKDKKEAINFYLNLLDHELFLNDYYPFMQLSRLYEAHGRNIKEVEILISFFKSKRYCNNSKLNYFKGRLKELSKKGYLDKSEISSLESEFKKYSAKNWELSRKPVPTAFEVKKEYENMVKVHKKFDDKYYDDFLAFDENSSSETKINIKQNIINKGEQLLDEKSYPRAISFFKALINHKLFINDYYPYSNLSKCYRKTKQRLEEIDILIKFFKSDISCDFDQVNWFKRRLEYHGKYGFIIHSKIDKLVSEFKNNISLNEPSDEDIVGDIVNTVKSEVNTKIYENKEIITDETDNNQVSDVNQPSYEILNEEENKKNIVYHDFKSNKIEIDSKMDTNNGINIREREQMNKVIEIMESGKTESQAAKLINIPIQKIFKWINLGKRNSNENTTYFYQELIRIKDKNRVESNNKTKFDVVKSENIEEVPNQVRDFKQDNLNKNNSDDSQIKEITSFNLDTIEDDEIKLLVSKFNDYIKNPFYKMDVRQFNLSLQDIEHVKNEIFNDILLKKIDNISNNFRDIFINYCKVYSENKNTKQTLDFENHFNEVNTNQYDELIIEECKLKTIDDYKSNKINQDEIKIRYNYHLKRKVREQKQLKELENIKKSPDAPTIKELLTIDEQNEIYCDIEQKICGNEGLNEIVLDYVRFLMKRKVEKNKSIARKKLSNFIANQKYFLEITGLNSNQIEDFIKNMELLIEINQIKHAEINEVKIKELSSTYLNAGKLFYEVNYGI